jgi:hypothetical protein
MSCSKYLSSFDTCFVKIIKLNLKFSLSTHRIFFGDSMVSIPNKNCYYKKYIYIFEIFDISENKCIFSVEVAKVIGYIEPTLLLTK